MRILSIETSCDETAISAIEVTGGAKNPKFKILGNVVSSQIALHAQYGGVFPALAKREHIKNLPIVLEQVLKQAKLVTKKVPVDMIAVTYGPGLEPALWTGIVFAKELSQKWNLPLVPVNHMEGHVLSVFGKGKGEFKMEKIKFPALALLISGGHTELVLMKDYLKYKIVGQTLDDAVGEAFDKVARMLGLPYPGGPQISKLAKEYRGKTGVGIKLPRPMLHSKNFDFSFSGLKTAVLYTIKALPKLTDDLIMEIACEFEEAATEVLIKKTLAAAKKFKVNTLIVGGGVAANTFIKQNLEEALKKKLPKVKLYFPERELATDNSLMIGIAGYFQFLKNKKGVRNLDTLKAVGNLKL